MKPKLVDIEIRTDLRPGDIGAIIHMHGTLYGSEHGGRMVASMLLMHRGGDVAQLRYFLIRPVYLWTVDELPTAAALYRRYGFTLTEEKPSTAFGKALREQRFDLPLQNAH